MASQKGLLFSKISKISRNPFCLAVVMKRGEESLFGDLAPFVLSVLLHENLYLSHFIFLQKSITSMNETLFVRNTHCNLEIRTTPVIKAKQRHRFSMRYIIYYLGFKQHSDLMCQVRNQFQYASDQKRLQFNE